MLKARRERKSRQSWCVFSIPPSICVFLFFFGSIIVGRESRTTLISNTSVHYDLGPSFFHLEGFSIAFCFDPRNHSNNMPVFNSLANHPLKRYAGRLVSNFVLRYTTEIFEDSHRYFPIRARYPNMASRKPDLFNVRLVRTRLQAFIR